MTREASRTDPEQSPGCIDATALRSWCDALPMTNTVQVQTQLLRQVRQINAHTLPATTRLHLLETLREPLYFVQEESAKRFVGKQLPLSPPEQAACDTTHGLWRALAAGYLLCLEACLNDAEAATATTLCQRALATLAADFAVLTRAGMPAEPELWRRAHACYSAAEKLGLAGKIVVDPLHGPQAMTIAAVYVELILLGAASLHELAPRQQGWVMRWARRWSGKVAVQAQGPPESQALPLCVDLDGATPARFEPHDGPGARWLDTSELRKSLKKRIKLLAEGRPEHTPAQLGLGDDCAQPACGETLRRIYPHWVKGGIRRRHERHLMSGPCRFVAGVAAIHYYLSGSRPFKPPGISIDAAALCRQREQLATFGHIACRFDEAYSQEHGYRIENWEVAEDWGLIDHSTGGFRLERPLKQAGGRLGVGQLIAAQPAGSSDFLLGTVCWVQIVNERLAAGLRLFPSRPQPVAVRPAGLKATHAPFVPGFLLPPAAALSLPTCAILPSGCSQPNRIMEIRDGTAERRIRLGSVLDRGPDFERTSYVDAD